MSDRSVDDILAELEPDRFAPKPAPAPASASQRSVDDIVAELEGDRAPVVDTRRPNVGMDDLDRSDLLGAGMDLGAAVESTSLQQGASPEDALRRRLEAEQTTMVLGPRADSGSVRRALEAREGQDSPSKAAQRALGQGLVPLPPAARTGVERDDEARRREREFREMGVVDSLKRAWAGNPDEQVPVENEVAADKLWLQRAKDDAGKVVLSSLTAGTYPLIRLALQKAGLGEYDLTPDATDGMESWSSLVEGLSGDEDVQALATPEAAGALGIKTLQASGIGPIVGKAAGAVEAALPDPLVKAAEEVGFDIGTTALFWDDVQPREKFDAAAQLFYETGDRSEVDGLTLRDLPARARGDSVDVAAFLRMANAGDPDLAFLNTIADKDERYLAAQIERLPLSAVGRAQPSLVPDTDTLRDIHVRRTNAKEYAGDAEADSLLRLMGAGLVRPVDNGENLLFVPGRMMEAMRLAGVPLAALNEIEVNPYRILASALAGPTGLGGKVYDAFPTAPEPGDTSLLAKAIAARAPTGAGLQSMAASGAFNDWLEWAGLDGGEKFASLYEPGSTWESRTLTATMLPEYQFRLLKDTYTRAGGDPASGAADVAGAIDLMANFLIPAEEIAIAPVMSAARAGMRARAASSAARELGMAGREARAAGTAAALSGDGLQSGGEALRRQAVELLESGQYDPDNLSVGARKNLLTVFQQAEVENPEQFLEELLDTLRDRRARVLDENAAVVVKGGPETQKLRASQPYERVKAELDGLVRTGNLTPADRDLVLRIEEAKALNAWDEGEIGSPEEWFASQEWRRGVEGDLANPDPRTLYSGEGEASAARTRADVEASPEFRNWFGDSKVVDAEGRPLVVYRGGTPTEIMPTTGMEPGTLQLGPGAYFAGPGTAEEWATFRPNGRVEAVYLSLRSPFDETRRTPVDPERFARFKRLLAGVGVPASSLAELDTPYRGALSDLARDLGAVKGVGAWEASDTINAALREAGFDGIVADWQGAEQYVAFDSTQIKSATGNRGTFDPNNPSILYSEEGGRVAGSIERTPTQPFAGRRTLGVADEELIAVSRRLADRIANDEPAFTYIDVKRPDGGRLRRVPVRVEPDRVQRVNGWYDGNEIVVVLPRNRIDAPTLEREIRRVLAHESTHAMDPTVDAALRGERPAAGTAAYYNDAREVTAFRHNIYRELNTPEVAAEVQDLRRLWSTSPEEAASVREWRRSEGKDTLGVAPGPMPLSADDVSVLLERNSPTWRRVSPHLTPDNRRRMLEMAAEALMAHAEGRSTPVLLSAEDGVVRGSIQAATTTLARPLAPTYYSALRRAVENLRGDKFGADQLKAALRNTPGVKADEIEWTGLDRFLAGKKSVTKAEALAWLDENGVVVEERVLGDIKRPEPEPVLRDDGRVIRISLGGDDFTGEKVIRRGADKDGEFFEYDGEQYGGMSSAVGQAVDDLRMERARGLRDEPTTDTQYASYTLPGGTNYREVLFKMPASKAGTRLDTWEIERNRAVQRWAGSNGAAGYADLSPDKQRVFDDLFGGEESFQRRFRAPAGRVVPAEPDYRAPHFGSEGENLLAHVRLNDRTGPNGERILFVEEVQSDWHQAGREKGYRATAVPPQPLTELPAELERLAADYESAASDFANAEAEVQKYGRIMDAMILDNAVRSGERAAESLTDVERAMLDAERARLAAAPALRQARERVVQTLRERGGAHEFRGPDTLGERVYRSRYDATPMTVREALLGRATEDAETAARAAAAREAEKPPDAPFAKTWPDLVMKRILRMAAEGGYDGVAWTPGIVQVKRYEDATRAAVDEIRYVRRGERVEIVGRKGGVETYRDTLPPEKLPDVLGKEIARKITESPDASGSLTGPDLTVGGEGMKGFYDRMLPNIVRDLPAVKKSGGRVERITIDGEEAATQDWAVFDTATGRELGRFPEEGDAVDFMMEQREQGVSGLDYDRTGQPKMEVPYLPLAPKIIESVLYEGQPLFQRVANTVRGFIQPNNTTSRWLIRLFQTGDIRTAFHEGGHLQALMRPGWEARAAQVFDSVNGRLTREGHEQLADAVTRLLRGALRPGSRADNLAADVLDTLGDVWARVRDLPVVSRLQGSVLDRLPKPIPPEFARLWDETFRPHVRTRPVAARLVDERQPRGMRAPAFVPGDMDARLAASKKRAVGVAEEAQRVDRAPAEIRAALGLQQGQDVVDPIDLLANAMAYIGTERMRRSWGFGELVPLTNRVAVPAARKETILNEWNARRMAALGGKEPTPDGTDLLFDANQQAGLRRLIYEAEDSPLGEILPASLTDENADLSRVAAEDYNRLMDIHKEIRAGMGAFRNARAEQAAVSGAVRLLGKAAEGLERTDAAPVLRKIKEMFSTSHVSEEYLGPPARDLIKAVERELAEVPSQIKREIIEVAEAWRKQGRDFKAIDLIRDLSYGVGPEVVPVDELGRLLRLNEITAAPDLARVVADLDEIDALFTNAPLTNAAEQVATESMAIAHLDQVARAMNDIDGISFEEAVQAVGLTPEQANDAMGIVVEGLRRRFASFENSAVDILISLTGTDDVAILDAIKHAPTRHAKLRAVYDAWYTGRWDAALDEVGRMGYATGGQSFDQGSAALTALLRLRSRQVLGQLAYRLADAGLTGDVTKLARGGVRYDRPYVLGAKADGREAFLEDVAGYISAITGWADRPEYRLPVFDADGVEVQPGRYLPAEGELTKRGVVNKDAYAEAVRVLSMWGFKTGKGTDWTPIDLPGGARVMVPNLIREPLEEVVSRASPQSIAFRVGSAAERIGDITPGASAMGAPGATVKGINAAMRILQGMWDYSYGMLRTGLLTGIGPFVRPAYYVGNAFGGFMQLLQGVGTAGTARVLGGSALDFGTTRRVIQRMYRDGTGILGVNMLSPAERGFFTKDGRYFTDSMIANMANRAGLNSSLPKSEFAESLIETVRREEPTWWNNLQRLPWPGSRAWREHLNEGATAIDNFYRVATFMDGLKQGLSDTEAAALARRVAFDYNDLTDFERQFARRTIMFYTFFRRNQDLFWWTLLNHPERVAAQLRLMNGLQREALETESEVYVPDWMDDRVPFLFRDALKEGHAANAQAGRMTITPGIPIPAALSLWLDLYGAAGQPLVDLALGDAPTKDERAIAGLVGLATPIVQLPFVAATGVDPDSGRELTPTAVPALLAEPFAELDDALTGGLVMRDMFGLRKVNPWDDASTARPGAPVWQIQGEGPLLAWWAFNNMTPAGPVLNQATQYDRAIPGGLNEPRVGLTEMDEATTIAGARTSTVPRREVILGREGERREKEINALRRDALRGDITKGE